VNAFNKTAPRKVAILGLEIAESPKRCKYTVGGEGCQKNYSLTVSGSIGEKGGGEFI